MTECEIIKILKYKNTTKTLYHISAKGSEINKLWGYNGS
jgi:hypothetical protein